MIPMHPHLISQLIADRQAGLMASARQQRLARQARAARRARPAQRGHAAPMLAALGRLAWRRSSPRTIQTPAAGPGQAAPALTPRELDLLKLLAQRLTNPDIAQQSSWAVSVLCVAVLLSRLLSPRRHVAGTAAVESCSRSAFLWLGPACS